MKLKSNVILTALAVVVAALLPVPLTTGALQETNESADESRLSYIVVQDAQPILDYDGGIEGFPATATGDATRPDPRSDEVKEYRGHLRDLQNDTLSSVDVAPKQILNRYQYTLVGFSVLLTESEADELRRHDDVVSVQRDSLFELSSQEEPDAGPTTTSNNQASAPQGENAENGADGPDRAGAGVVVGVIDTGIWPEHPSFADNDDDNDDNDGVPETWTTNACAFGASDYNPDDVEFECNDKLIGARNVRSTYTDLLGAELYNSARDYTGHGTQTAAIAAGNASVPATVLGEELGPISGVASAAHLAAYSACGSLGCYASDVITAIDRAVADGVDVINYSIVGGTSPTSAVGVALLRAASAGVSIATAAGNDGPGAGTVGSPANEPWVTTVAADTRGRDFAAAVTVNGDRFVGASVTAGMEEATVVDGASRDNPRCDPSIAFQPALEGEIVLCASGAVQRTAKSRAVSEQGGAGMILFNQNAAQALVTDSHSVPTIHVDFETGTTIKEAIAATDDQVSATIEKLRPRNGEESTVPNFSSRGPNVVDGGILKPDLSAPGTNVLTATTPTPLIGQTDEQFQTVSGTSMSSAAVAGLMALVIEDHPGWTAAAVKSALMTTADGKGPHFAGGAGAVSLDQVDTEGITPLSPGIVFDARAGDYTGYLCETAAWAVTGDSCANADGLIAPADINQPSIAIDNVTGSASVTRTLTNVSGEELSLAADVAVPEGVEVEVSPTDLSVDAGETATFEVAVTIEDGANTDKWTDSSITWKNGDDVVARMPVVIQPVALEAPGTATIEGGQADLDLRFGYDGAFEISAHGITGPDTISDTVAQDTTPEGNSPRFRPADRKQGGATAHEIEVSDAVHLRLTLGKNNLDLAEATSDLDVDLDLYLYDSEGKQVARSTSGGTAEIIDIAFPKDDTYTLYVHGWAVGDGEVGYSLSQWVVPADINGALEVTEAPASASTGEDATVQLEWSDGDINNGLGVVVYQGSDGRLATTLVEVR